MQICQSHWDDMRAAIDDRGLSQFVSKSGEEAAEKTKRQVDGGADAADFDPLLSANWAIFSAYLRDVGLAGMSAGCPLCAVERTRPGLAKNWIEGSCEDQLNYARHVGLVPKVQ